jgi:pimeloyl-ACP methyl ester carboxylesterase
MNRLIILPGWGGNKETWEEFTKLVSNDFEVEIIELPCFGDEPCPTEVWGVEEYADFVQSKVKSQKSKVVLLGHSFGGQVAAYLCAKNPEICDKLILSGPAVFRPKKRLRRAFFGFISKVGKWVFRLPIVEKLDRSAEKMFRRVSRSADYADTSGIKRDIFTKIIREDLTTEVKTIETPTLIIWGTKDTYVPVKNAYKLNKLITNSKLEIIKNGKHGLHIQQPKNLLDIIKKYVFDN